VGSWRKSFFCANFGERRFSAHRGGKSVLLKLVGEDARFFYPFFNYPQWDSAVENSGGYVPFVLTYSFSIVKRSNHELQLVWRRKKLTFLTQEEGHECPPETRVEADSGNPYLEFSFKVFDQQYKRAM
jgi:hypothetical protein